MSEIISDKDYIVAVLRGERKSSRVEIATKSINCTEETIEIKEEHIND